MADISDVYGDGYHTQAFQGRVDYILNNICKNLAHRTFNFRLQDSSIVWEGGKTLPQQSIIKIIQKVHAINKHLLIKHIHKNSRQINMIPELLVDTPVEYFLIIDQELGRAYMIFITPMEVGAY